MRTTVSELAGSGPHLSVGLHAADLLHLGDDLDALERGGTHLVHLDVMDGVFCPQTTFGPLVVSAVPDRFVKDVHLMVDEPLGKLDQYIDAGASILTFHLESTRYARRALSVLSGTGVLRGVAINPGTPVGWLDPLLDDLELVLLLTIEPGFSEQRFAPTTARRITELQRMLAGREVLVGIDGAISAANVAEVAALGPDVIVSGSAVFRGGDAQSGVRSMLAAARSGTPLSVGHGDALHGPNAAAVGAGGSGHGA